MSVLRSLLGSPCLWVVGFVNREVLAVYDEVFVVPPFFFCGSCLSLGPVSLLSVISLSVPSEAVFTTDELCP